MSGRRRLRCKLQLRCQSEFLKPRCADWRRSGRPRKSEAAFHRQIWNQSEFHDAGDRVFPVKDSLDVIIAEGLAKITEAKPSCANIDQASRDVGQQAYPGNTGTTSTWFNWARELVAIEQTGEIDPCMRTERVV